jgi:hypothetical protein
MPPELIGAKVFGVTGHEHQWGTNVFVASVPVKEKVSNVSDF